ncbi:ABC transporter permease [Clostridium carnis]
MNNLLILLKINLISSIGINKFLKEKSKSEKFKMALLTIAIIFALVSVGFTGIVYSSLLADGLSQIGFLDMLLVMGLIGSVGVTVFTSLYKSQGVLFSSKDYEILMSLPIKPSIVLASKMIQLLILNYLFTAFIFLPPAIVYFTRVETSIIFFIYLIIIFLFLPLIPIVISSIIAFGISYISSKVRYKNLILTLGTIIVFMLIMVGSFKMQNMINIVINNSESIMEGIGRIYPPIKYATNALVTLNVISLLIFIVISISIFIVFLIIFAKLFKSINSKLGESYKRTNYKMTSLKESSVLKALIFKEIKRYFSTPIYVLNTGIGSVIIIGLSIAILFAGKDIIVSVTEFSIIDELIPLFMVAFVSSVIAISCTTSCSISIEGKNLWILKSSPIKIIDIFKSKIALNLIILIPTIILNSIILFFALKLSATQFIWILIVPTIFAFTISAIGLLVNLFFPKFDWVSETVIVKQSMSVFLTMVISMGIVAVPIVLFIWLKITKINLFLSFVSIALLLIFLVVWIILKTKGKKLFERLS